jgi:hypothetical protein
MTREAPRTNFTSRLALDVCTASSTSSTSIICYYMYVSTFIYVLRPYCAAFLVLDLYASAGAYQLSVLDELATLTQHRKVLSNITPY